MRPNEMKSRANSAETMEQSNGVGGGRKSSFLHVIITPLPTIAATSRERECQVIIFISESRKAFDFASIRLLLFFFWFFIFFTLTRRMADSICAYENNMRRDFSQQQMHRITKKTKNKFDGDVVIFHTQNKTRTDRKTKNKSCDDARFLL
jgi:hypothetical protein